MAAPMSVAGAPAAVGGAAGGHAPAVAGAAGGPTAPLVKALPPSSSSQPASSALKDHATELAALRQELEQLQ
eukprot:4141265-Pyramimonas_sp.AAC.1